MTFQVPPPTEGVFEFDHEGTTYSLPKVKTLSIEIYEEMMVLFQREQMHAGLSLLTRDNEETTLAMKRMQVGQLEALINAWQADSGVTMGESVSSAA